MSLFERAHLAVKVLCLAIPLIAGWAAVGLGGTAAEAEDSARHVLILYPDDDRLPSTNIVGEAVTERLVALPSPKVVVFSDFLDLIHFAGEDYREGLAAFLARKHASTKIDVVVALGPPALDFMVKYRDRIAPGARIVFALVSSQRVDRSGLPRGEIAGVFSQYDLAKTMELAVRLQPDARSVVVVSGSSEFDRAWEQSAHKDLAPWSASHDIAYLGGLDFNDLLDRVSHLSRNTIVLILTVFEDKAGRRFQPRDAAGEIANAARAPSYGPYDTYVGHGVVGGYSDTFASTGVALADLALDALAGKALEDRTNPENAFRVDARQLKRWGPSEANLPPGTIVLFGEKTFWEEHGSIILVALTVVAIQTVLLALLLIQRTRRRHAEVSLRESEERMAQAAAAASVGLWRFDLDGGLWTSAYCQEMFGLAPDEALTPERVFASVHPDDRAATAEQLRGLEAGMPLGCDFRLVLPDGEVCWIQAISDVGAEPDTGRPRVSGIFKDISARRRAELEVQTKQNEVAHISRVLMVGELSFAIAHELNQPLMAILANARASQIVLGRQSPDLEEALSALEEIVEDGNRAGQVIQRLRGMLKKEESRRELVDLNEIVRSTHLVVRNELIIRKINATLDLAPNLAPVLGDPVQLQQVAMNLLVNAMDAVASTDGGGREIVVSTRPGEAGRLEITVLDNGPGIPVDAEKRLFQPFFTTKSNGLGLGLAICHSILGTHGGSLRLSSAEQGGAIATVILPAAEMLAAAQ